jgi:hypothetical protein
MCPLRGGKISAAFDEVRFGVDGIGDRGRNELVRADDKSAVTWDGNSAGLREQLIV